MLRGLGGVKEAVRNQETAPAASKKSKTADNMARKTLQQIMMDKKSKGAKQFAAVGSSALQTQMPYPTKAFLLWMPRRM